MNTATTLGACAKWQGRLGGA